VTESPLPPKPAPAASPVATSQPLPAWALVVMALLAGAATALGAVVWLSRDVPVVVAPPDAAQAAETAGQDAAVAEAPLDETPTAADLAALELLAEATGVQLGAEDPLPESAQTAAENGSRQAGEDPPSDLPVRIVAEPAELRVWDNTKVRLHLEFRPDAPDFERFVWHFEDGSQPVTGVEVSHTFAESVRDRHVTVEAHRTGQDPLIVSRRLPVERLEVVPLSGEAPAELGVGDKRGTRLLFVSGEVDPSQSEALAKAADRLEAQVLVMAGDEASTARLVPLLEQHSPGTALVAWSVRRLVVDPQALDEVADVPLLRILRDKGGEVQPLQQGQRSLPVMAVGQVALTAVDTRADTVAETELKRARDGLQLAAAYPTSLLLSARPLTMLRDGELIADRAYRLYEYALRNQVGAVVSTRSGVAYDGRFGGLAVIGVGQLGNTDCARLAGHDSCQPPTVSMVEVTGKNRLTVLHLLAPDFTRVIQPRDLPAEVAKVRR
jgi:hypothetical protein